MIATDGIYMQLHRATVRTSQMGYIILVKAQVAMDLWRRKQTLSLGFALGLGQFTAMNPWPCALTIT